MRARTPRRSRPRWALPWPAILAIAFALLATLLPPAAPVVTAPEGSRALPPRVSDPQPAPGSVVQAGPVVIGARVHDAPPIAVSYVVDGMPVSGIPRDPDGQLTALDGIEVVLPPGPHRIGVVVAGHGVLREWDVVAGGLDVQVATEGDAALARRLRPAAAPRPVAVLADLARPDLAVLAGQVAAVLGGRALAVRGSALAAETWAALQQLPDGPDREVVLLGDADALDPAVEDALRLAGYPTARIAGATAAAVATAATAYARSRRAAPADVVVVAPDAPAPAVRAAAAASRLAASLVLVPADGAADPGAAALIGQHPTVLLSTDLTPPARAAAVAALAPGAVASDDDLAQTAAQEAVVVADGVDEARTAVAAMAASPGRAVLLGADAAADWVGRHQPARVTLVLPEAAVPALPVSATRLLDPDAPAVAPRPVNPLARAVPPAPVSPVALQVGPGEQSAALTARLRQVWVDGPDRPDLVPLVEQDEVLRIALTAPAPVGDAQVHVTVLGYEWPGQVEVDGLDVVWTGVPRPPLPLPLEPPAAATPTPITVTTAITTGGRTVHDRIRTQVALDPRPTTSPEGWLVAGGGTGVTGTGGRLYTYSVEVEPATGLDLDAVEAEVTAILTDARSWTADGSVRFQRVGSAAARIRVVVATPATVDAYCGAVGLRTGGRVSCWDGFRSMLNLDRWTTGVPHFGGDMVTYRQYLVNHEVGHGLGNGHVGCPRPGMLAPVMMQQTGGVGACQPNGWPFPG